jgi:hypothetical protein
MESYSGKSLDTRWTHKPDMDITDVIWSNISEIDAQFDFVKGHQDKTKNNKTLDFPAQLYIMANAMATQQQQLPKTPRVKVTTPGHHIVINGMTLTRDAQKILMETASKIPMQQYFRDKYGWSEQVFTAVHWELQYRVLQCYDTNDQRHILKYAHGWLPTNKQLYCENQSMTTRCTLCHYIVEDEQHLFTCQHPDQQKAISALYERIQKEIQTSEEIKTSIITTIHQCAKDTSWKPTHKMPIQGARTQNEIGWSHIMQGQIAKKLVQGLIPQKDNVDKAAAAETNGQRLIRAIWDTFLTLWRQRNAIVFGESLESKKRADKQALELAVNKCYEYKNFMPINDRRRVFQIPREEMMKSDTTKIKQWARMAKRIIRTSKRELQRDSGQRKMMYQYFKWNPPDQQRKTKPREQQQHWKHNLRPA